MKRAKDTLPTIAGLVSEATVIDRPLAWGILGCARICRRGIIPAFASTRTARLTAIASRDLEKAREWGAEFGIPHVHSRYEALIASSEIDAVYIPLPNEMHLPWTIAAAEAGKHVLCEKPLALDAQQAREMAHACRQNGVVLMEAFMWRHQPRTHDLLRRVRSSEIGELRLLRSSFSFSIDHSDWRLDPARGGGALMDVGCYGVSMARLFTGTEPTHASTMIHSSGTQVDMTLTTQLRFPGGALAVIDCSFEQPYRCCYELVGQSGSFEVAEAYLPTCSPSAILRTLGTDATPAESHRLSFDSADQYAKMIDAFGDSVDAGRLQPLCEDGVSQMEAIDMIRRSLV